MIPYRSGSRIWSKFFLIAFCLVVSVSYLKGINPGRQIGDNFLAMAAGMLKILPGAFVLIGLFEVWVRRETVEKYLGKDTGISGHLWAILLAGMVVGPLYVSFPMAYAMHRKGARPGVVFTYINASAICRIPMTIFEASFLGFKFTAIRFLVSLPLVVTASVILEKWGAPLMKLNSKEK